ncbi:MAG: hypothetical protein P1U89_08110 [Verrucomicrobiales bacterium]|nr:hypothetical protein [Verrucomicrobiales bacterium]
MARRPRQEEERSMDSLMDAMTNVVGILLLILIVSSLGITAAVKEIMENMPEISEEQLEAMRTSRKKTLDNLEDLRATQANVQQNALKPDEAQQLALALEKFEKENEDLASKTSDLDELLAKSRELEPLKEEKQERNTVAVKELNDLQAALAAKPMVEAPPAREITLPDPRPADPEAYVYYVACKYGKLYVVGEPYELMIKMRDALDKNYTTLAYKDAEFGNYTHTLYSTKLDDNDRKLPFMADFQARTRKDKEALGYMQAVTVKTLSDTSGRTMFEWLLGKSEEQQEAKKEFPVRKLRLDPNKVKSFFASTNGKGEFDFIPSYGGDGAIKVTLKPNPEKGMTEEHFLKGGSEFVNLIKKAGVNRRVILMFIVSSDSFDTYLKARDYTTSQRIPAGWILSDGENLPDLLPNKRRESIPMDLAGLPAGDYLKLVQFAGAKIAPKINAVVESFDADLASIKVPEEMKGEQITEFQTGLKAYRAEWVNGLFTDIRAMYQTPLAAAEMKKVEDVALSVHPPYIPHVRIFNKRGAPPTAPKPPRKPPSNTRGPTGPKPLILD